MLYSVLQKNLEKLIKDKNYHITELERKAGAKKNSVYNILSGASKKPAAELLQSIADVLGVSIKDLYSPEICEPHFLTETELQLIKNICNGMIKEVVNYNFDLTWVDFSNILKEAFDYSSTSPENKPDEKFIKWLVHKKCSKAIR